MYLEDFTLKINVDTWYVTSDYLFRTTRLYMIIFSLVLELFHNHSFLSLVYALLWVSPSEKHMENYSPVQSLFYKWYHILNIEYRREKI